MSDWSPLEKLLDSAVGDVFPGAGCIVVDRDRLAWEHYCGELGAGVPVAEDSLYDIASLTKILATTATAMVLAGDGRLDLDLPVTDIDGKPVAAGRAVTARRLLAHAAGLPAWQAFFAETGHLAYDPPRRRKEILRRARATAPAYPADERSVYSDVGFLILTDVVEHLLTERLDTWCRRELFVPMGMPETFFIPAGNEPPLDLSRIAPTEIVRGEALQGRVHDENARAMGGVAGHAGLFSTARDVARFAMIVLAVWHGRSEVFDRDVVHTFTRRYGHPSGSTRCLGWDSVSEHASSTGSSFARSSVGHLGFTGCSLWIDLENEVAVVLLSNRVHPSRTNNAIRAFRPRLHDQARSLLGR